MLRRRLKGSLWGVEPNIVEKASAEIKVNKRTWATMIFYWKMSRANVQMGVPYIIPSRWIEASLRGIFDLNFSPLILSCLSVSQINQLNHVDLEEL